MQLMNHQPCIGHKNECIEQTQLQVPVISAVTTPCDQGKGGIHQRCCYPSLRRYPQEQTHDRKCGNDVQHEAIPSLMDFGQCRCLRVITPKCLRSHLPASLLASV